MNPGLGTSDGTFRNKRYFACAADSGVFVGLDKLTPLEDAADLKSQKPTNKDENTQANFRTPIPSFWKGKNKQKSSQGKTGHALKSGQRVVAFIRDNPTRGTVRYIGEEKDFSGNVQTIVGLEMVKKKFLIIFLKC